MTGKRILAIFLACLTLFSVLLTTASCRKQDDDFDTTNISTTVSSDGKKFTVKALENKTVISELPDGDGLPVVGDRETLLKLLMERGALYDNTRDVRWHSSDGLFAVDDAVTVPESVPAPASDAVSTPTADTGSSGSGVTTGASDAMSVDIPLSEASFGEAESSSSHSETNEQVAGVNEGDIVKTDGQYLYALSNRDNRLRIIHADGTELEVVSSISFGDIWGSEFYIIGNDRLAVIGGEHVRILPHPAPGDQPAPRVLPEHHIWYGSSFTTLIIYDISDRTEPNELRRVSMDGWNVSTRVINGTVYLVTNKYVGGIPVTQADSPYILPYCRDTAENEEFTPIGFNSIHYVPGTDDTSYLLIGAIDIYDDETAFEPKAYLGAGSTLYMSHNAMYITQNKWVQEQQQANGLDGRVEVWMAGNLKTEIMRFAINGTEVNYSGKGMADGTPINQYSMDEHNGFFRIATTDWNAGTYVTVLNASNMQTVGRTEPLAPGEQMHSMRFMGNMGYVVTFLNVDPLFTIDLSDPYNPKMLGELKIPGFSQYLHPVGNGLLLGIGRDTQEIFTRDSNGNETVIGFNDTGMRVTLFDVNNPFDPREVDVLTLGEGWTEVSHNPRALMCDSNRNLYGFISNSWTSGYHRIAATFLRIENGRLSVAATLNPENFIESWGSRLCYIGDTLYFIHNMGIIVYDYYSFEKLGSIIF